MAILTEKQATFVQEYLIDLNATQAAIRAGFSPGSSARYAVELLNKTHVAEAIRTAMGKRAERTQITQDKVLEQYARLAFFDIRKLYDERGNLKPVHEWDDESAAAVAGVETVELLGKEGESISQSVRKIKLTDRRAALADIGKHLNMFKEQHEHTGKNGGPIEFNHNVTPAVQKLLDQLNGTRSKK